MTLARVLLPQLKRHRLNLIAKALGIPLLNHHRAVDDAEATAHIFIKFLEMLKRRC
ncbi:exonuclease domain-containing protein [Paraclostridium bifermentans]|nr:exonuclease domain-containing protein [Paraclostridium bifermentans]